MESRRDYFNRKTTFPGLDGSLTRRDLGSMASKGPGLTEPTLGKFGELNEKESLHGLNSRLAGFIEKVRQLERHNHLMEREIQEFRDKAQATPDLEQEYGPELRRLRQLVQDVTLQKKQMETEHQNLEEELCKISERCENEAGGRSGAERNITVLKRDISDAYEAKLQLEKKAQSLVDEIHLLKTNHEAEVSEMTDQIQVAPVNVKEFGKRDLTETLRDIRAQLEGYEALDLQQTEKTFRSHFAKLTKAAETKREVLKATQREIQECRKRLQARNIELDCAKGTREAIEQQLYEAEERHSEEILHYQDTIKQLENELINSKFDMSAYLREYQDLVNVKMALDVEILSYRKLLCGEEARMSRVSDSHVSTANIYHQSPFYALPRLSRQGAPQRRAEPQYKFVEEIITETTREIEMLEYEETVSGEADGGEEQEKEQERAKSDRGGSEEDDNKVGREEDGVQECDSEQDQVGGENVGGAGEVEEEGVNGGKIKEESKTEVDESKEEHDTDAPSKVKVTESKDEREDEERIAAIRKDPSSKPEDSKPEVLKEEEDKKEESLTESKPATLKDTEDLTSAQAEKPADETSAPESQTSAQTQELTSVVKVQTAQTLAAQDSTKEQKSERAEAPVWKDPSSKQEDSKPEVLKEEEDKKEESLTESKPATIKDTEGLTSAQAEKPADETSAPESQASAQTQEPSSIVEVQTAQTLAAQDLTKEQKSETAEASENKDDRKESVATKSEEKERRSPTPTPTVIGEVDSIVEVQAAQTLAAQDLTKEQKSETAEASENKDDRKESVATKSEEKERRSPTPTPTVIGEVDSIVEVQTAQTLAAQDLTKEQKSETAEASENKDDRKESVATKSEEKESRSPTPTPTVIGEVDSIVEVQTAQTLAAQELTKEQNSETAEASENKDDRKESVATKSEEKESRSPTPTVIGEVDSIVEVQTAQTLAAQDLTKEQKSETAEASENKDDRKESAATKSEEKESRSPTPTVIGKVETPKREDEAAKSIQDVTRDKDLSLQSNVGGQKPNGDDKTQKVQTLSPEAKMSSTVEVKEVHQGAPDSSQVQKSELLEGSDGSGSETVKRVEGKAAGETTESQKEGVAKEAEKKK